LLLLFACVLAMFAVSKSAVVDENKHKPAEATSVKPKARQPYCGLYCLYTVMKLAGKEIDFKELVKPEYLGSRKGSSLVEIKKAAKDNGLYAESTANLNSCVLMESPHPIILHVKSSLDSKDYDHFELFPGTEHGQAKLFGFPEPVRLIPFHELSPRWDGTSEGVKKTCYVRDSPIACRITPNASLTASSVIHNGGAILTQPPPTPTGANISRPLR